ncbi:AAA family ATPase [Streptomyces sp. NPDC096079]|uniref:AAA family ATPase n=1 Tax=Streptomyces sp. NPDC096079 TaxID=3155820 RepID=UPI00331F829B
MKRYGHGLVPGAFHPPHAGHHHLVRTARDRCERLTVVVRGSASDTPPLEQRVAWMREIHPDVLVVGAGAEDVYAGPERVDAVFVAEPHPSESHPSEPYPSEPYPLGAYGAETGAETVLVHPEHALSDTAVREDPAAFWDFLEPSVRSALTRRVVVLGAERTGVTTMALALADHYRRRGGVWARTRYVPDHARAYGGPALAELRSSDFPVIAQGQAEREEAAARDGSPVLLCDTDAFAAAIRHERYTGTTSTATAAVAAHGRQHLWLLTDHRGVDCADADRLRPWMTARLLTQLTRTGRRTAVLTGPHEERLAAAVAAVDALLAEGPHLTEPLPELR